MTWAARQSAREVLEQFTEAAKRLREPRARFQWWWRDPESRDQRIRRKRIAKLGLEAVLEQERAKLARYWERKSDEQREAEKQRRREYWHRVAKGKREAKRVGRGSVLSLCPSKP